MKIFNKVSYDSVSDACYISISDNKVKETLAKSKFCFVDIDDAGGVVGIEILNAKKNKSLINSILFSDIPINQCI